jgi:hypothetical protein
LFLEPKARRAHVLATLAFACVAQLALSRSAQAQAAQAQEPPRYLLTATSGASLRVTRNEDFAQETLAPLYADLLLGLVPGSTPGFRHGFGLGASLNLSEEGGFTEPVAAGQQLVLMPAYLLYRQLDFDFHLLAHLGVPFALVGAESFGLELGGGLGYRLLAGLSLYGELAIDAFLGERSIVHPLLAAELGVLIELEVLP